MIVELKSLKQWNAQKEVRKLPLAMILNLLQVCLENRKAFGTEGRLNKWLKLAQLILRLKKMDVSSWTEMKKDSHAASIEDLTTHTHI